MTYLGEISAPAVPPLPPLTPPPPPQLKSAASEDRLSGCITFSQLVSRKLTLDVLHKHRLVRLVGPLLVDPCVGVRQAAAGALRWVRRGEGGLWGQGRDVEGCCGVGECTVSRKGAVVDFTQAKRNDIS